VIQFQNKKISFINETTDRRKHARQNSSRQFHKSAAPRSPRDTQQAKEPSQTQDSRASIILPRHMVKKRKENTKQPTPRGYNSQINSIIKNILQKEKGGAEGDQSFEGGRFATS